MPANEVPYDMSGLEESQVLKAQALQQAKDQANADAYRRQTTRTKVAPATLTPEDELPPSMRANHPSCDYPSCSNPGTENLLNSSGNRYEVDYTKRQVIHTGRPNALQKPRTDLPIGPSRLMAEKSGWQVSPWVPAKFCHQHLQEVLGYETIGWKAPEGTVCGWFRGYMDARRHAEAVKHHDHEYEPIVKFITEPDGSQKFYLEGCHPELGYRSEYSTWKALEVARAKEAERQEAIRAFDAAAARVRGLLDD